MKERGDAPIYSPVNGGSVPAKAGTMGAPPRIRLQEGASRVLARKLRKKLTDAETVLWSRLRAKQLDGLKFRRQRPIKAYVADFACIEATLVIEVDGATHSTKEELEHDVTRTRILNREGWRIVRVSNTDVYKNLNGTLETILRSARCAPSVPDYVRDTSPVNGEGKNNCEE